MIPFDCRIILLYFITFLLRLASVFQRAWMPYWAEIHANPPTRQTPMKTPSLPRRRGFAGSRWFVLGAALLHASASASQVPVCVFYQVFGSGP
jgi:hypothetical protein